METVEDGFEFAPPRRLRDAADEPHVEEGWVVEGRTVHADLHEDSVEIRYGNGAVETRLRADLAFCPECVREDRYPFGNEDEPCVRHHAPRLGWDLADYERFELLGLLARSS